MEYFLVSIYDETKGWELAWTIADDLSSFVESGDTVLQRHRLHAGESGTYPEIELYSRLDRIGRPPIELDRMLTCRMDLIVDDGRESCSHDSDVAPHLAHLGNDFAANVFSLSIAIGPYHDRIRVSGFTPQILSNRFGIVAEVGDDRSFKELGGGARVPALVLWTKIGIGEMTADRGDGHIDHTLYAGHAVLEVIIATELVFAGSIGRVAAGEDRGNALGD